MSIPFLGAALLLVLIALGEHNTSIARLLCCMGLHVWPSHGLSKNSRVCTRCAKRERAHVAEPQPWDWY